MPRVDEQGKAYELAVAGRVGAAVQARRKALDMTAAQLASRAGELGYPMTRVTITKIETNTRSGKLDVAEWLVLAAALQVPPALLLLPSYPDGGAVLLPEFNVGTERALAWLAGILPLPNTSAGATNATSDDNAGIRLIASVLDRNARERNAFELEQGLRDEARSANEVEGYKRLLDAEREAIIRVMGDLTRAKADLWRNPKDETNAVLWDQRED